jgi:hypothetical protein
MQITNQSSEVELSEMTQDEQEGKVDTGHAICFSTSQTTATFTKTKTPPTYGINGLEFTADQNPCPKSCAHPTSPKTQPTFSI